MNPKRILTAEWRKLIMANYIIDPRLLYSYLPANTEPDSWNDKTYVSLVGFSFLHTRLRDVRVPFHTDFPEVNLRFYVRYKEQDKWKRGVVFIREIVPKPALTWVANTIYGEKYTTLPMKKHWDIDDARLNIRYTWRLGQWHSLEVIADPM